jgi:hypothetical protein
MKRIMAFYLILAVFAVAWFIHMDRAGKALAAKWDRKIYRTVQKYDQKWISCDTDTDCLYKHGHEMFVRK